MVPVVGILKPLRKALCILGEDLLKQISCDMLQSISLHTNSFLRRGDDQDWDSSSRSVCSALLREIFHPPFSFSSRLLLKNHLASFIDVAAGKAT